MAGIKGYLEASDNDEMYSPYYCVDPIIKYIPKNKKIWCPFDKEWSAFVQSFKRGGYTVTRSHIDDGQDFFEYEPDDYDVIVSNPPFSIRDKILERLYELNKPFAVLLPTNSLQGKKRYELFKQGIQLLCFDSRIGFHYPDCMDVPKSWNSFSSSYFCRDVLPRDLIIEKLEKYDCPLK